MDSRCFRLNPLPVVACSLFLACAEPAPLAPSLQSLHRLTASDGTPIVGRLSLREGTVELTRTTVAAGGPAHDLARGVAKIIADVDHSASGSRVSPSRALDLGAGENVWPGAHQPREPRF